MPYITLTKDFHCKVSWSDHDWACGYSWCADVRVLAAGIEQVYAVRYTKSGGRTRKLYMHREIVRPPEGWVVDHISGDGLDNRRQNLRLATAADNLHNASGFGASRFKGVTRDKRQWRARITRTNRETGKRELLFSSQYETELEAARGYDLACIDLLGPYARLNFPVSDYLDLDPVAPAAAELIPF